MGEALFHLHPGQQHCLIEGRGDLADPAADPVDDAAARAAGLSPTRVVAVSEDSPSMRQMMRRHGIQFLVREPSHTEVWRLLVRRALYQGDRTALAMTGAQLLGCLEGPFDALRRLRQPGPSRLDQEGDLP